MTAPPVTATSAAPAGVLRRLAAELGAAGVLPLELGTPGGGRWRSLEEAAQEAVDWQQVLVRREGDERAAAAFVSAWIVAAPALVVGLPAVLAGVAPEVGADQVLLHRSERDVPDGYAIAPTVVRGGHDALGAAARTIASLAAPLVADLCDRLPVGPVATWGALADTLAGYAVWFARTTVGDEVATWERTERLLDRLADEAPLRPRPRLLPVVWSGGTGHVPVRGTCCLYYRTGSAAGRGADRYCATCPLRSDADRDVGLRTYLEATLPVATSSVASTA